MKYSELVDAVAEDTGLSKSDAKKAADAVFENVAKSLEKGDGLQVTGFGSFTVKHRPARTGRNPATGEEMQVPAKTVAHFKPGKGLADRVNG